MSRTCNCASCTVCTCPTGRHRCDVKAQLRRGAEQNQRTSSERQPLHYNASELKSVTAADYRPPSAAELAAGARRVPKPQWSDIHNTGLPAGKLGAKFEGESQTASSFRGAQNRPASASQRPFFDRGDDTPVRSRPAPLPFDARTGYADDFRAPSLSEARNARTVPKGRDFKAQLHLQGGPGTKFDATTTNRNEFRAYDQQEAAQANRDRGQQQAAREAPPRLKFDAITQSQADFQPKKRDPTQPIGHREPEGQKWIDPATKFEARTVSQDSFRGTQPSRPTTASQQHAYERPPPLPFEGVSQSKASFRPYDAQTLRESSARRHGDAYASHFHSGSALYSAEERPKGSWETETRGQFTNKQVPCPAIAWETPQGGRTPASYD